MAAKKAKQEGKGADPALNQPDESVSSSEADPAVNGTEAREAVGAETSGAQQQARVRRRTTRTIKRSGDQYDSEIEEVVEDFDAPPLMDRAGSDYPSPVG